MFYLSDAVVTLDVDMMDKNTILTSLRNSLKEIDSRYVIERQYADKLDDSAELGDLTNLYDAILSIIVCYRLSIWDKVRNGNKGIKGDDRWMTKKEMSELLYCADKNNLSSATKSGIILAEHWGKYYIDSETIHSLIIGATRAGKGQTFILPMIREIAMSQAKHSLVINDPKGEILEYTYDVLKNNGYKNIWVLNLVNTSLSMLWDCLYTIKKEYVKAMKSDKDLSSCNKLISSLANVFTDNPQSDPIWPDSARQLLIAMILYLIEYAYPRDELDKVNMYTVYNFFIEFGSYNVPKKVNGINTMINALDEVFKSLPIGNLAKAAYATSKFSSGDTRSSIFTTLASNINIFGADMGVSKLTSANQIDFSALLNPDEPCAIFMVVPDEEVSRHVIASLFVNQCYNFLVGESRKYEGNKLPVRTHFILDEFGNMPSIPAMDNKITVSAGRNILFDLAIQDFNQLEAKYKGTAKTIRSNMGNIVYINSLDKDTNEYISAILGDETIEYHTYSGKLSELESHQNLNIDKKTLMSATQLSRLEFGEAVIKRQRCYPIRTKFTPFYKLNAKVTRIDEIPLAIDKRSLKESMLSFDEIWKSIQLEGPTSVDKTAAARPVSPKSTANNDLTEKHNRAWLDCDTASHGEFLKLINAEDYKGAFKVLEKCSKLKRLQYEDTYSIIVAELTQLFNN